MKKRYNFLEARYFGLIIGLFIFVLFLLISNIVLFKNAENFVRDVQIGMRNHVQTNTMQKGVTEVLPGDSLVSQDIVILGADTKSLNIFGRWPWPRYRHADLLSTLARIQKPNERENAVMLDFFFFEPSNEPQFDANLSRSIEENGKTFLEGVLVDSFNEFTMDPVQDEIFKTIIQKQPSLTKIHGDTTKMPSFYSMMGPLIPFAKNAKGFGHATFYPDPDLVFRNQLLVGKVSRPVDIRKFRIDDNIYKQSTAPNVRMAWFDKNGRDHTLALPLSDDDLKLIQKQLEAESPGVIDEEVKNTQNNSSAFYYEIYSFEEFFIPSITLSLACNYLNVPLESITIKLGEHIALPAPSIMNTETGTRMPYKDFSGKVQDNLYIPINEQGGMLINYMGPRSAEPGFGENQTYTVRSYAGYADIATQNVPSAMPESLALNNHILLGGAFSLGMSDDEKQTPVGLMYGVEIHANALNTIITGNFIENIPSWLKLLILFSVIMGVAVLSSRAPPAIALVITFVLVGIHFFITLFIFEFSSIVIDFVQPGLGMLLVMVTIIVYRVMTEERDKRMITAMFGKYVSPQVVDQLIQTPPELGGVDKEITVFFSDIRGFTTLSEAMTPQELVNHLNVYLTAMTDIIHEYYGTLDKYVGDEVMCFWGAPLPQPDHALLACKCAIRQMQKLAELNETWPVERRIDIGIGINSGIMTVGNMGSIGRMNYTLMGDNVNLGARLEGTNKQYTTHIIISEFTYGLVKDKVIARELDNIRVKGKNKPVLIYELIDIIEGLHP